MNFIQQLIENQPRENIKYIYPGDNDYGYAKMIAALANDKGGRLILGLMDDGNRIIDKGYSLQKPNKEKIKSYISGFENFEISEVAFQQNHFVVITVEKEPNGITFEDKYYMFANQYNNQLSEVRPVKLFISYNHLVSELADILETNLHYHFSFKVEINRDTQLGYRDSIEDFMRSIKQNNLIISLISNSYLQSEACMYEISELMKDDNYIDRLAYIIIGKDDSKFFPQETQIDNLIPQIYGSERFKYIEYWTEKHKKYQAQFEKLSGNLSGTTGLHKTINRVDTILKNVDQFIEILNELKGQDFSTMQKNQFHDIHQMISLRFNEINSLSH